MTIAFALSTLLATASAGAMAQADLADPTRPPTTGAEREGGSAQRTAQPAHRLQSVLIAPGRRIAVIDGKTLQPGERIDGATLLEVSETGVVLRRGAAVEELRLYPGVSRAAATKGPR